MAAPRLSPQGLGMSNPILTIDEQNNIDAGPWFSTLSEELRAAFTGVFSAAVNVESLQFLGGETVGAMMDRCLPAFDELLADPTWTVALCVLHGGINRALLGHALTGGRTFLGRLEQSPACINVLDIGEGDIVVRATNLAPTQWLHERERYTTMEKLLAQYLRGAGEVPV